MANESLSEQVAGSVRAELARRRLGAADIAPALGIDVRSAQRRLSGHTPFAIDEVAAVAAFLGTPVGTLLPGAGHAAVAA